MKASVSEYEVLYTSHLTQKHKTWHDGILRYHHLNGKAVLLDNNGQLDDLGNLVEIASAFYRPPSKSRQRDAKAAINEGEKIPMDTVLVEVGSLLNMTETDLSGVQKATEQARDEAKKSAREWAAAFDEQEQQQVKKQKRPPLEPTRTASSVVASAPSKAQGKEDERRQAKPSWSRKAAAPFKPPSIRPLPK